MLDNIWVFTSDSVWQQILLNLGASVSEQKHVLDIDIDEMTLDLPISVRDLVAKILLASEHGDIMKKLFGNNVPKLSQIQKDILVVLYKSGGLSMAQLRDELRFAPDIATHTLDTAISQIRKMTSPEFILNKNGKYIIGKL